MNKAKTSIKIRAARRPDEDEYRSTTCEDHRSPLFKAVRTIVEETYTLRGENL
jgi:hypothetical protein